jgi:hypothetical protein
VLPIMHLDGSDVVVIDSHGQRVPAVDEVRVEPGLAVVAVNKGAHAWLQALAQAPGDSLACAIRSRSGHLHHMGAVRVVCV